MYLLTFFALLGITFLLLLLAGTQSVASDLVYWLVLFAWGGLGASFGPTLALSLYWHRTTKWGVLAGLIVGSVTTSIWNQTPWLSGIVYELLAAFFLSLLTAVLVSRATKAPEDARDDLLAVSSRYSWRLSRTKASC